MPSRSKRNRSREIPPEEQRLKRARIAESSTLFLATFATVCVLSVAFTLLRAADSYLAAHNTLLTVMGIALVVLYLPLLGILLYMQRGKVE